MIDAISEGPVEGPVDGLKSVLLNSTRCWTVRGILTSRCHGGVPGR
ncbi:putative host specificity protein [Escherichia coli p0305293.6]|nr:putative host specificity protein [Escherichia coli p0305293.6]